MSPGVPGLAGEDRQGFCLTNPPRPRPTPTHLGRPAGSPTCHSCWKLPPAMSGLTLLGLASLLGLGAGAPLCLSQQLRMPGDYVLGGLFPLGSAGDTELSDRTQPNSTVCTR